MNIFQGNPSQSEQKIRTKNINSVQPQRDEAQKTYFHTQNPFTKNAILNNSKSQKIIQLSHKLKQKNIELLKLNSGEKGSEKCANPELKGLKYQQKQFPSQRRNPQMKSSCFVEFFSDEKDQKKNIGTERLKKSSIFNNSNSGFEKEDVERTSETNKIPSFLKKSSLNEEPQRTKLNENNKNPLKFSQSDFSLFRSQKIISPLENQNRTEKRERREIRMKDFEVLKTLGMGKYGKVFLAREKSTNFISAIKAIQKNLIKEEEIVQQITRQLKIQSFLSHPNIVKLYGFFSDHKYIYLILEPCLDAQLLKKLKSEERIPEQNAVPLLRQVLMAVEELHSHEILHRDLKPENIVIHENVLKVCDFGWSVFMDQKMRKTFCGTPLYVSPEVLRGKEYNEKVDIWSFGILAYEMLIGENPFKIQKEEDLVKIVTEKVTFPSHQTLSKKGIDLLKCCLNKDPQIRFNVRELLNHQFFAAQSSDGPRKQ